MEWNDLVTLKMQLLDLNHDIKMSKERTEALYEKRDQKKVLFDQELLKAIGHLTYHGDYCLNDIQFAGMMTTEFHKQSRRLLVLIFEVDNFPYRVVTELKNVTAENTEVFEMLLESWDVG